MAPKMAGWLKSQGPALAVLTSRVKGVRPAPSSSSPPLPSPPFPSLSLSLFPSYCENQFTWRPPVLITKSPFNHRSQDLALLTGNKEKLPSWKKNLKLPLLKLVK